MDIQLGDKIRDKVSGLTGIATGRIEYLNGCIQYGITPQAKDGKTADTCYFDERQIEVVKKLAVVVEKKTTGGPSPYCP